MKNDLPPAGPGYSRVVRRGGKARRESAPPGPLADYLNAQADLDRLERDGARLARARLREEFGPAEAAMAAFVKGVTGLYARLMAASGYRLYHQAWRRRRLSAAADLKLELAKVHTPAALETVTDLYRTALDLWLDLAAGGDAGRRAALGREVEARRAAWAAAGDPPALARLVDAATLAWVQELYLDARYAHALAENLDEVVVAAVAGRADAARQRGAKLRRELEDGRARVAARAAHRARLADLAERVLAKQARPRAKGARRKPSA